MRTLLNQDISKHIKRVLSPDRLPCSSQTRPSQTIGSTVPLTSNEACRCMNKTTQENTIIIDDRTQNGVIFALPIQCCKGPLRKRSPSYMKLFPEQIARLAELPRALLVASN
ncbi:hypothetical protein PS2_026161 [Malus domestica]